MVVQSATFHYSYSFIIHAFLAPCGCWISNIYKKMIKLNEVCQFSEIGAVIGVTDSHLRVQSWETLQQELISISNSCVLNSIENTGCVVSSLD